MSYSSGVEALRLVLRFIWPLVSQFSSFSSISVHASLLPVQPHSHSTLFPPPAVSAVQISPADSCKSQTCQQSPAWLPALTLHRTRPWQAEKAPLCPFFPEQALSAALLLPVWEQRSSQAALRIASGLPLPLSWLAMVVTQVLRVLCLDLN